MIVVKDAIINHRDVEAPKKQINPGAWWKDYYMYRNRFFFINEFSTSKWNRFLATIDQKKIIYFRMISALIKRKFKGYRKIKIRLYKKAIKDAKLNKRGIEIDPATFKDNWLNNK